MPHQPPSLAPMTALLLEAARWAPSADNTQPWRMLPTAEAIDIYYDPVRAAGKTFGPDAEATELAAGAMMDSMARVARAGGWAPGSQYRPDRAQPLLLARLALAGRQGGQIEAAAAELDTIRQRHTNRHPFKRTPVSQPAGWPAYRPAEVNALWLDDRNTIGALARLVSDASALRFQNQEVHEWLAASLRFTPSDVDRNDGLDVATFHLPPGGRQLLKAISSWTTMQRLNRIHFYRLLAAMEAQPVRASPALVAIVRDEQPETGFLAGELMQQVWVLLNQAGLAVQPFYVIADQLQRLKHQQLPQAHREAARRLEQQVSACLGLRPGHSLAMLLRVGHPAHRPVASRRISLQQLMQTA